MTPALRFWNLLTGVTPGKLFQMATRRAAGHAAASLASSVSLRKCSAPDIRAASCALACAAMWFVSFSIVNVVICVPFAVVNTAAQHIHPSLSATSKRIRRNQRGPDRDGSRSTTACKNVICKEAPTCDPASVASPRRAGVCARISPVCHRRDSARKGKNILDTPVPIAYDAGNGGVVCYGDLGIAPLSATGRDTLSFLSVYLDESYSKNSPTMVVAGFVSEVDRWAGFATLWKREVQDKFSIPYLHMKEFYRGQVTKYKHLSNQEKAQLFVMALKLISSYAEFGVVCRISPTEYRAITTRDERARFGTEYTIAVLGCIGAINQCLGDRVSATTLSVYLDHGHRSTAQAIKVLKETREYQRDLDSSVHARPISEPPSVKFGVIDSSTKNVLNPLQASDLLAYGMFNCSDPFLRFVLGELSTKVPICVFDANTSAIRSPMDRILSIEAEERERRNRIARLMGTIGGKIRKSPTGGYMMDTRMVTEKDHTDLVAILHGEFKSMICLNHQWSLN